MCGHFPVTRNVMTNFMRSCWQNIDICHSFVYFHMPAFIGRPVTQQLFSSSVSVIGLATLGLSDELCHFRLLGTTWKLVSCSSHYSHIQ